MDGCLAARIATFQNSFIFALLYADIPNPTLFLGPGISPPRSSERFGGGFRDDSQAV
jgi:hypothetical protein